MGKIKLHHRGGWTAVPNELIESQDLSWKAKGLFTYLQSRPDGWEVREADLIRRANDGRTSLRSAVQELEQYGWLSRRQERVGGQFQNTTYTLHVPPLQSPWTGNPSTENPSSEDPSSEDSLLSNTEESKTETNNTHGREALTREALHWVSVYPERDQPHNEQAMLREYIAAREAGASEQQLIDAAGNYRHWCRDEKKLGTRYVFGAHTFLRDQWQTWVDRTPKPDVIIAADGTRYLR